MKPAEYVVMSENELQSKVGGDFGSSLIGEQEITFYKVPANSFDDIGIVQFNDNKSSLTPVEQSLALADGRFNNLKK